MITPQQDPRLIKTKGKGYGLGRVIADDYRDVNFLMSRKLKAAAPTKPNSWRVGPVLDQGTKPHCVGYAWAQFLRTTPIQTTTGYAKDPTSLYVEAQKLDEWPGEDYDGTSTRAGAKALLDAGNIKEYRWAWNIDDVVAWIAQRGPVVVGTHWYSGMFKPDAKSRVTISGTIAGGHAYLLYGQDPKARIFRMINSWGPSWGLKGKAIIGWDTMQRLFDESGEAVTTSEVKVKATR